MELEIFKVNCVFFLLFSLTDNQSFATVKFAVVVSAKPLTQTVLFVKDPKELGNFFIESLTNSGDTVVDDMNNNGE